MKLVLIGGYPKGYDQPFHPETHSGQVLHRILKTLDIEDKVILCDLWANEDEEKKGVISEFKKTWLSRQYAEGNRLIALGVWVETCLQKAMLCIEINKLPHPASRDRTSLWILKDGLEKYALQISKSVNEDKS